MVQKGAYVIAVALTFVFQNASSRDFVRAYTGTRPLEYAQEVLSAQEAQPFCK